MKARRQHVSTCEGAELVWDTFPLERGRKTSENRDLITNLKRVFLLSLSASVSGAESNKVKVAPVHISCTWKGCQEAPGSMRASLSAVLILRPRLGSLAQTHGAKRGHLTTPKPQLILFYHLYQVSLWRSAKSLAIIFVFLFFWLLFTRNGRTGICSESDMKSDVLFIYLHYSADHCRSVSTSRK